MKPVTYDFDVITDSPRIKESPQRRKPEGAEQAPQPDAEKEQRHAAAPDQERGKVRAAE